MKRQIRHIVTLAYLSVCNRNLARLYARVTGQAVFVVILSSFRFLSLLPSKVIIIVIKFMFLSMNKYWALLISF